MWARLRQLTPQNFLYRTLGSAVILGVLGAAVSGFAQEEKPLIIPGNRPQQNKKPKKGKDPRAVGVLQFNKSGKVTLVPVAILIEGRFYDASAYKADPVPMALETGTVYEAEQGGDSQGLFTISGALHGTGVGIAHPWFGTGTFLPQGSESPKTSHKAENRPVGLDDSGDEPPRLTRKDDSKATTAADSGGAPASTPPRNNPAGSAPEGSKPDNSKADTGGSSRESGTAGSASSDKPTQKADQSKASPPQPGSDKPLSQGGGEPADSKQTSGDYYRPTLRRGKPTQAAPPDDDRSASIAGVKGAKTDIVGATPAKSEGERVMAAISDAGGPAPESYKFFWKTGEENERRAQMVTLAENEVRKYIQERTKGAIGAKPTSKSVAVGASRKAAKQPGLTLENIQFLAFDVWLTNQPVMIFSAEAHLNLEAATAPSPSTAGSYSVTLVARTDIYGNVTKIHAAVTDKFHLDVTARLEMIDAVDADGDGRGELLFRETSETGSGYVIYRVTADKLWTMFDSLNAE
jgi:hypothetical protein